MLARPSTWGLLGLSLVSTLLAMLVLPTGPGSAAERRPTAIPVATSLQPLEAIAGSEAPADLASASEQDAIEARASLLSNADEPAPERVVARRAAAAAAPTYRIARVSTGRTVALHASPRGRVVARIGARTEFGSRRVLAVVTSRGSWFGVTAIERPNGKLAWVRRGTPGLSLSRTKISLHADLSRKSLVLRVGDRDVARMKVAIGRPGSTTPSGRFQVTDKLSGGKYGPYYGCCILALSGKQPNLPAGWKGGNRLAIHGTNAPGAIGKAASAGCLRGSDRDMKLLMRRVPVGTQVFIRP